VNPAGPIDRDCFIVAARADADGAPPLGRKLSRYLTDLGAAAVSAALADFSSEKIDPARVGVYTASGAARYDLAALGVKMARLDGSGPLWSGGLADLDPFALLKLMSCNVLSVLSMALPAEGASEHHADDAPGGIAALAAAAGAIRRGAIDWAVVVAFDDLASDHARAELAASGKRGDARQLAVLHLSAAADGARARLGAVKLLHGDGEGTVGGGAALSVVVEALASLRDPILLAVETDGAVATVELLPVHGVSP